MKWEKYKDSWYAFCLDANNVPIYEAKITKHNANSYVLKVKIAGYFFDRKHYGTVEECKAYFEQFIKKTIELFQNTLGKARNYYFQEFN